ncbi:MAG: amino acid ABC transporter permease [Rhodospirillales bacterium]|nr:amino acid ABC transporter permease [Rhodospirillales bacterium]
MDWLLFGAVLAFAVYTAYRVNDVLVYHWDWSRVAGFIVRRDNKTGHWFANILLLGLFSTLRLAWWGTVLACIIGLIMGACRASPNLTLRIISRVYVELIRNIPAVVFIFVFYFFVSTQLFPLIGLNSRTVNVPWTDNAIFRALFGPPGLLTNFLSGLICLAMFEGAYITEIVRAGIQSVPKGQWEAARAIGLSRFNIQRDVILPQAVRKILPPLAGQFITLIKDSSIVSLISIQELTYMGNEVANSTARVFETWIIVGVMYFAICYTFAVVFGRLESMARRSHR